jgi:hypothetical protein
MLAAFPRSILTLTLFALTLAVSSARAQDGVVLTADAGPDQTLAASMTCDAIATLDGSASTVPEGQMASFTWTGGFPQGDGTVEGSIAMVALPVGTHEIVLTVATEDGARSSDSLLVTVGDRTPPRINAILANPDHLWPPAHTLVPVEVLVDVSDFCDQSPVCSIVRIKSNEPVNGRGDGNTSPDWRQTGPLTAEFRAERSGRGRGRVYTIDVECSDASGNTAAATANVMAPHDQRRTTGATATDTTTANNGAAPPAPPARTDHTKIAFSVNFNVLGRNRLVAKLDASSVAGDLPSPSLANHDLILEIGIEEVFGTFDGRNRIVSNGPVGLRAKLTRSGFLVVDVRGLDLPDILFLDPAEDLRNAEILVPITAFVLPPADGSGAPADPIVLFDDILITSYRQKAERNGRGAMKP